MAATGRRVGLAAIVLAVVVPAALPGVSDGLLTSGGASGPTAGLNGLTVINPVLTLRDNLTPRRNIEILRYNTTQADVQPLRIVTADTFDGDTWKPGTRDVSRRNRASQGLPTPPGLSPDVSQSQYTMRIEVSSSLDQDFLPLPYPTRRVDIKGAWLYDASSLNVIGDGETVRGKDYTATYLAVRPTVDQLRNAPVLPDQTHAAVHPPAARPAGRRGRDRPRGHQGPDQPVRPGDGAAGVVPHRRQVHLLHRRALGRRRRRGRRVPARAQGLLRPVLLGDGRDGPHAGHPGPDRRGLPARHRGRGRLVVGQAHRRARLARAVLPERRLGAVRAHPRLAHRLGPDLGAGRGAPGSAGTGRPTGATAGTGATATASVDPRVEALQDAEQRERTGEVGAVTASPLAPDQPLGLRGSRSLGIAPAAGRRGAGDAGDAPGSAGAAGGGGPRRTAWTSRPPGPTCTSRSATSASPCRWSLTPRQVDHRLQSGRRPGRGLPGRAVADHHHGRARALRPPRERRPTTCAGDVRTVVRAVSATRPRSQRVRAVLYPHVRGRRGSATAGRRLGRVLGGWDERIARATHRLRKPRLRKR